MGLGSASTTIEHSIFTVLKMTKSHTDCAAFAIFNLLCIPSAYQFLQMIKQPRK